jgi:penicillin-binding protein 1C
MSRWPRWRRRLAILLMSWIALRVGARAWPHDKLSELAPSSIAVYDRKDHLLRLTLATDEQYRLWTPLGQIAPSLREAALLYEDRQFYRHFAVNPWALLRATRSIFGGRKLGASTITMQLARRIWRIPSHTARGKLTQIARAVELELLYGKDEILEAYLNLVPYGGNVEGAGAASLIYFGKPAEKISLPEALALAVIPQSPEARGGALSRGGEAPGALTAARRHLFDQYMARHPEARRDEALVDAPISVRGVRELPFLAPHFVESVLRAGAPGADHALCTSLDLSLQRIVEKQLHGYVERKRSIGVRNAAALLVDTRTMAVRALVGSADYDDAEIAGQVSGVTAKRSPGSALKPFVYALGLDEGVLHPMTMLKDAPLSFAAYSPENFDGRYVGPLSATDALVRSRNIPAVTVASKLSRPSFYTWLKQCGITRLGPEERYGLGLALGVAEVTMEELVGLYAALAADGRLRPLRYRDADPEEPGQRVLSREAAFVVTKMLEENPRPDALRAALPEGRTNLPVAWKTGTSWGFRDAWSVGLFGPYVLAVWVGNFDGQGNPAFVGVQAAAPLFFQIVDAIVAREPHLPTERAQPSGVRKVSVCALSGRLPGPSCPRTRSSWFIPGRSPIDLCDIHRALVLDEHGRRTCPPYHGPTHTEVFEVWPSDLSRLFAEAGLPRRPIPPLDPRCPMNDAPSGSAPRISSPLRGVTYSLRKGQATIALEAIADGDAHELFWFVGDELVGRARRGESLFWAARAGAFHIRVVDDLGRSDERSLRVERID